MPVPRWTRIACDNQCVPQECPKTPNKLYKCFAQNHLIDEAGESNISKTLEKGASPERRKNPCSHFQPPADWDRDKMLMLAMPPAEGCYEGKKVSADENLG